MGGDDEPIYIIHGIALKYHFNTLSFLQELSLPAPEFLCVSAAVVALCHFSLSLYAASVRAELKTIPFAYNFSIQGLSFYTCASSSSSSSPLLGKK